MKSTTAVVLSALLALFPALLLAAQNQQGLIKFGDFLLAQKRYKEALLEYQRALYLDPSLKSGLVIEKMFRSGIMANDFHYVLAISRDDRFFAGSSEFACQRSFFQARALYGLNNLSDAMDVFTDLPNCHESLWQDRGYYFNGLVRLRQAKWKSASDWFGKVSTNSDLRQRAQQAKILSLEGASLGFKSPGRAALFGAILPGSGYAYAGLPQTALAAFVTNGLFVWATITAAQRNAPGLATVAGLFSFGWYFGSIQGSFQATQRRNERLKNGFIGQFELE